MRPAIQHCPPDRKRYGQIGLGLILVSGVLLAVLLRSMGVIGS